MMARSHVVICILVGLFNIATSQHHNTLWEQFKTTYSKRYGRNEEFSRYNIWKRNHVFIHHHNQGHDLGLHSFRLGINQYMDSMPHELPKLPNEVYKPSTAGIDFFDMETPIPSQIDWRSKGCVSPVYNQGQLGQSWSIVAADTIESDLCVNKGLLTALSYQNLVDCCNMTVPTPSGAFECVHKMGGIDTESFYPATGEKGPCHFDPAHVGATCKGSEGVPTGDEVALQKAVATVGPVAVVVDASKTSFQLYISGIYDEPSCSSSSLDHVMLVVGYGTRDGLDYWIVKNSWGQSWGMEGYILMSRNKDNQCGIASMASYPKL